MSSATLNQQSYRRGVSYALAAGIFMSLSGLLIRYLETGDAFLVLFYRSLAFFVSVVIFILVRNGQSTLSKFRTLGAPDLIVSVATAFSFIFYILSMFYTSVANAVLLISTGPFFAAILGWLVLREPVGNKTLAAMVIAGAGVAVMVSGNPTVADIKGMSFAAIAVLAFAVVVVTLRSVGPEKDMMPAMALAGVFAAVFCMPFIASYSLSAHDLLISISLGSAQVGLGFILITLASRSVPSAQIPLYLLGETVLAPVWVWLLVNEVPAHHTLIGGALVLAAVLFTTLVGAGDLAQRPVETAKPAVNTGSLRE